MSFPTSSVLRLALALVLLSSGIGHAAEIAPSISSEIGWDSNRSGSSGDGGDDGDGRLRVSPQLDFRQQTGRFRFDTQFRLTYEDSLEFKKNEEEVDQFVVASATWAISARTELSIRNSFARTENIDRSLDIEPVLLTEPPDPETRSRRSTRNISTIELSHAFTPRWLGSMSASYQFRDFRTKDRSDRSAINGSAHLRYVLNARANVGLGVASSYDSFEATQGVGRRETRRGSRSRVYRGFVSLLYQFAPDLTLDMQVGPGWLETRTKPGPLVFPVVPFSARNFDGFLPEQLDPPFPDNLPLAFPLLNLGCQSVDGLQTEEGCFPGFTPILVDPTSNTRLKRNREGGSSNNSSGLQFFAQSRITKAFEWGEVSVGYNRSQGGSGGLGRSTINDTVLLSVDWQPTALWEVTGSFSWDQRESAGRSPLDVSVVQPGTIWVADDGTGRFEFTDPGAGFTPIDVVLSPSGNGFATVGSDSGAEDITSYLLRLSAERQMSERFSIFGNWNWRRQENDGSFSGTGEPADIFRLFLGFRYRFDPYIF